MHPAQVFLEQSCPWPLNLMTSEAVEGTWIRTQGYRWFRGECDQEWDTVKKLLVHF